MANDYTELDESILGDFGKYLDEYVQTLNMYVSKYKNEDLIEEVVSNIPNLTSDECMTKSLEMSGYATYLKGEMNENIAKLKWCEDTLNRICADSWSSFSDYVKYEIKKYMIIKDNEFALKVEKLRSMLQARITILEDRIYDVRSISETLKELGRKRGYDERS